MFEWLSKLLSFIPLFNKKASLITVGLDFAGKSTLIGQLKSNSN